MRFSFWRGLALALLSLVLLLLLPDRKQRRTLPALHSEIQEFLPALQRAQKHALPGRPTGLIVPHHLLVRQCIANAFATVRGQDFRRVVILCPDHFHLGRSPISVIDADFATPFGPVRSDTPLVRALAHAPGVTASDIFYREHGIGSLLPFLHHELPQATVCAVVIKADVTRPILDGLFEVLAREVDEHTLIVQSTDFSHYLPEAEAETKDTLSCQVLLSEDPSQAFLLRQPDYIDSVGALYLQARLQREVFHSRPLILEHLNSQRFANHPVDRTTSYFVVAYVPSTSPKEAAYRREMSLLFTGDIMLGRGVAELAERKGLDQPFQGMSELFHQSDAVVVNLEGPLSPPLRPEAPLCFHFAPSFASAMAQAGITHAGLANNHGLDQGSDGLAQTREILRRTGLTPLGDPAWDAEPEAARVDRDGIPIRLVAFNATGPYFQLARKTAFLKRLRAEDPHALIIVSIHWGHEYMPRAHEMQRRFGRAFVDAGADLVVGHHPHVVQDLERYRGRLIVYSLGNLIFDQWTRPETRWGLVLKVLLQDRVCELIPVDTHDGSPYPAGPELRSHALAALARISLPELKEEILSGRIRIDLSQPSPHSAPLIR